MPTIKKLAKTAFFKIRGVPKEFDRITLPWIDRGQPRYRRFHKEIPQGEKFALQFGRKAALLARQRLRNPRKGYSQQLGLISC